MLNTSASRKRAAYVLVFGTCLVATIGMPDLVGEANKAVQLRLTDTKNAMTLEVPPCMAVVKSGCQRLKRPNQKAPGWHFIVLIGCANKHRPWVTPPEGLVSVAIAGLSCTAGRIACDGIWHRMSFSA